MNLRNSPSLQSPRIAARKTYPHARGPHARGPHARGPLPDAAHHEPMKRVQALASALPASALPASALPASALPASALPASALPASALPASALPASALPASALPASALPASTLAKKTEPPAPQGLRKLAHGCIALALLTLASCAHCQRCGQHGGRDGSRCAMHGESTSCSKCPAPTSTKGARTGATADQKGDAPAAGSRKPAPDQRKAKAELPGTQTQPPQPLWFRWR
jgi:hypothetical protein